MTVLCTHSRLSRQGFGYGTSERAMVWGPWTCYYCGAIKRPHLTSSTPLASRRE